MRTFWVHPMGVQTPKPGTKLKVQLEQDIDGRPVRRVGWAVVYRSGVLLELTEASNAGRAAVALLEEDCVDAWYHGSEPKVRLRP